MNADEFESHLRQQPWREVPPAWRREILRASQSAANGAPAITATRAPARVALWTRLLMALRTPQAALPWAGLAAAWVVIFALNHSNPEAAPVLVAQAAPASPQIILALREQNQLLTELLAAPSHEADRPKAGTPRPRSECHPLFLTV